MKAIQSYCLLGLFFFAATEITIAQNCPDSSASNIRRLNFVVSSKQKKFDMAPFSFQLQAKLMRLFHKKELFVIIARSSEDAVNKITAILKSKNAMIGSLWFDSHGHWQRRRSLFEIGEEEFNYMFESSGLRCERQGHLVSNLHFPLDKPVLSPSSASEQCDAQGSTRSA